MATAQASIPSISAVRSCRSLSSSKSSLICVVRLPESHRRNSRRRSVCRAMVQQAAQGAPANYAKEMERLSAKESLLAVRIQWGHGLYVEKWAPFVKELDVVVARGRDNSIMCYPVFETIHKENICHIVKAPADLPWKIQKLATDVAYKAVSSLEGAGVFAVELFLTSDGQILLNEVAPRPHNSGHHTIESCFTSQHEQHLRAVVGPGQV